MINETDKQNFPLSITDNIVIQELNGEVLIYNLKTNKAHCLNETAALAWQACDGTKSIDEIGETIGRKLGAPVSEELIWLALENLERENLITDVRAPVKFESMSRREVIRKIGFASMIALPMISSLIAPTAAHAASIAGTCANPLLTSCTTDANCLVAGSSGDTCDSNCCIPGPAIPGGFCIPGSPGCPPGGGDGFGF